jgi:ABC-type glutathione transport system ATPase component
MANLIDFNSQIFKVEMVGSHYRMINTNGTDVGSLGINTLTRRKAFRAGKALKQIKTKSGTIMYRLTEMDEYSNLVAPLRQNAEVNAEAPKSHNDITEFIHSKSLELKPQSLVISDLKWKYLIRSAVRAKNIMMVGPSGCGKTIAAKSLVRALNQIERKVEYVTEEEYERMKLDYRYNIISVE